MNPHEVGPSPDNPHRARAERLLGMVKQERAINPTVEFEYSGYPFHIQTVAQTYALIGDTASARDQIQLLTGRPGSWRILPTERLFTQALILADCHDFDESLAVARTIPLLGRRIEATDHIARMEGSQTFAANLYGELAREIIEGVRGQRRGNRFTSASCLLTVAEHQAEFGIDPSPTTEAALAIRGAAPPSFQPILQDRRSQAEIKYLISQGNIPVAVERILLLSYLDKEDLFIHAALVENRRGNDARTLLGQARNQIETEKLLALSTLNSNLSGTVSSDYAKNQAEGLAQQKIRKVILAQLEIGDLLGAEENITYLIDQQGYIPPEVMVAAAKAYYKISDTMSAKLIVDGLFLQTRMDYPEYTEEESEGHEFYVACTERARVNAEVGFFDDAVKEAERMNQHPSPEGSLWKTRSLIFIAHQSALASTL